MKEIREEEMISDSSDVFHEKSGLNLKIVGKSLRKSALLNENLPYIW